MISRKLNKRIEIWKLTQVSDGFGGYTVSEALINRSWAHIKTFQAGRFQGNLSDFGIVAGQNAVQFTVRRRNDLTYDLGTMFIKYRNVKYTISTAPTDIDFNDNTITFMGVAETTKSNTAG